MYFTQLFDMGGFDVRGVSTLGGLHSVSKGLEFTWHIYPWCIFYNIIDCKDLCV